MKRILLTIMVASILAGCGGSKPVAYRPIAYGENNQCYFVQDPAEVHTLYERGLCDRSWVATPMPSYWHQRYYPYYSSPAYYDHYVPAHVRTVYVISERNWGESNRTAIATATKEATYKGSNGKTVPASKIGAAKYGGGARFGPPGTKFGGGARDATPATATPAKAPESNPAPAPAAKTPAPKATPSPAKSSPAPKATPAPRPKAPSSGGTKSYGGGSRSGGGGYSGGGSKSYGGGSRR